MLRTNIALPGDVLYLHTSACAPRRKTGEQECDKGVKSFPSTRPLDTIPSSQSAQLTSLLVADGMCTTLWQHICNLSLTEQHTPQAPHYPRITAAAGLMLSFAPLFWDQHPVRTPRVDDLLGATSRFFVQHPPTRIFGAKLTVPRNARLLTHERTETAWRAAEVCSPRE